VSLKKREGCTKKRHGKGGFGEQNGERRAINKLSLRKKFGCSLTLHCVRKGEGKRERGGKQGGEGKASGSVARKSVHDILCPNAIGFCDRAKSLKDAEKKRGTEKRNLGPGWRYDRW